MKYPFNIYGWTDFKYKFFRLPKWNRQLGKRANWSFHIFDISKSLVEYTFAQFEMFYELYKDRINYQEEVFRKEIENFRKDFSPYNSLKELKNLYQYKKKYAEDAYNIYMYITKNRKLNEKMLDDLTHYRFKDTEMYWEKYDKGDRLYEMKDKGHQNIETITWTFNEQGLAEIKRKKAKSKRDMTMYDFENALYELDTKMAQKIIEMRAGFWD